MTTGIELPQVRQIFDDSRVVVDNLREYYAAGPPRPDWQPFSGRWFEHLGGGGDRPETAHRITAEDLVAVEMLSVRVPAPVSRELLEGPLGVDVNALLTAIPLHVRLVDDEAEGEIGDQAPAWMAWKLLKSQHNVGWVTAGKLAARKRPHLLPVYDDVVRCAVGSPPKFWASLRDLLRADGAAFNSELEQLRAAAGLDDRISVLRVFDVAVWRSHEQKHRVVCKRGRRRRADPDAG